MLETDLVKFPDETTVVGRLLSGYGELEFDLCFLLQFALDDQDAAFKALFRARGETWRIDVADGLMRKQYAARGIAEDYEEAIGSMRHCLKIRNQYAHCHWIHDLQRGLCFVDLEEIAKANATVDLTALTQKLVTLALLREQEAFFRYTQDLMRYLNFEYRTRTGSQPRNPTVKPTKPQQRPPLFQP